MRRILVAVFATAVLLIGAGTAGAASPGTGGQPSQSCLSETAPLTPGNASSASGSAFNEESGIAGGVYAGNGISATTANSSHAVSQYDVACFEVSQ